MAFLVTIDGVDGTRIDTVLRHMRERGGRITTALRAVVEVLDGTDDHLTAQDIATAVQAAHPAIHVSTIYRALDRLSEAGMVSHLHVGHAPVVYHLGHDHHGHLVCGRCGAVVDVPATVMRPVATQVARDYGFTVEPSHLALGGLCSVCAAGSSADALSRHSHG